MFLHGYLSCADSFNFQIRYLKNDFEIHAIDLKGFGKNIGMETPYSLDDYVDDVVKYIFENDLNRPHVIAHSFGARVAIKCAYKYPEIFDKIVITGGAGLKRRPSLKKAIKKTLFKALKCFVPKEKLTAFYSSDYLKLDSVMKESFVKIIGEHLDYALPYIKNKTLVICGDKDKETPLYMAKRFNKAIKNSEFYLIKGAGHFAFVDKSNVFNVKVRDFLLSEE